MTLNLVVLDRFLRMQNSGNTVATYKQGISNLLDYLIMCRGFNMQRMDWSSITPDDIVAWKEYTLKSHKEATVSVYWDAINSFFNFMVNTNALRRSPLAGLKRPQRVRDQRRTIVDDTEVAHIIECAGSEVPNKAIECRNRAMVALMANGLRISEIAGLNVGNLVVTDDDGYVNVTGKGNKQRTVPLNPRLVAPEVRDYRWFRPSEPDAPMFVSEQGRRVTTRTLQRVFERAVGIAGLSGRGYSPHSMRHNYATRMLRGGVPVPHLSKMLGHSDVKTTMLYVHLSPDDVMLASKMDPLA